MHDIELAFALIGAYATGILTLIAVIAYLIKRNDARKEKSDEMAMAEAVGVVQDAMPGSTILSYER